MAGLGDDDGYWNEQNEYGSDEVTENRKNDAFASERTEKLAWFSVPFSKTYLNKDVKNLSSIDISTADGSFDLEHFQCSNPEDFEEPRKDKAFDTVHRVGFKNFQITGARVNSQLNCDFSNIKAPPKVSFGAPAKNGAAVAAETASNFTLPIIVNGSKPLTNVFANRSSADLGAQHAASNPGLDAATIKSSYGQHPLREDVTLIDNDSVVLDALYATNPDVYHALQQHNDHDGRVHFAHSGDHEVIKQAADHAIATLEKKIAWSHVTNLDKLAFSLSLPTQKIYNAAQKKTIAEQLTFGKFVYPPLEEKISTLNASKEEEKMRQAKSMMATFDKSPGLTAHGVLMCYYTKNAE
jgi:hypothetical protein